MVGAAPGYDEDWLRSRALRIGEHEVKPTKSPEISEARYILRSSRDASQAWIEFYDPLLNLLSSKDGSTHVIPENAIPNNSDWNIIYLPVTIQ